MDNVVLGERVTEYASSISGEEESGMKTGAQPTKDCYAINRSTTTVVADTASNMDRLEGSTSPPAAVEVANNDTENTSEHTGTLHTPPIVTTTTTTTTTSHGSAYKRNSFAVPRRQDSNTTQETDSLTRRVAVSETRLVHLLRLALFIVLLSATILASVAVYTITQHDQQERFQSHVTVHNTKIVDAFHQAISNRLQSINAMATAITSHALSTNQVFPNVTLPHFELRADVLRVNAQTHAIHYMPVIHNDTVRMQWEAYAMENRYQIDTAFLSDLTHRQRQDEQLGYKDNDVDNNNEPPRQLQAPNENQQQWNETILGDGTGYHPRIWSNGAIHPKGDYPGGENGPYLPLWQRSPVSGAKQALLNLNFAATRALHGVVPGLLEKEAVINRMTLPTESGMKQLKDNFGISQYRHEDFETYAFDPVSFFAYPVLDSFAPNANVAGVLATNMYWRLLFSQALPDTAGSFVCILENSFHQTMSYMLDGSSAVFLGEGDFHDTRYDDLATTMDLNAFYADHLKNAAMRSYTSVPLSTKYGRYKLSVYPTSETEEMFLTNQPWMYTSIVAAISIFTAMLFGAFAYFVERRQNIVMDRVVQNAEKAAATERDLNEYLAHEIRNPLSSAILAHKFVKTSLTDPAIVPAETNRSSLLADSSIVDSSLQFIDEFLQSMLLMYRAAANKIDIGLSLTNLYQEVFKPVSDILSPQKGAFEVLIECHPSLVVMTDPLRLKQILLNLGRNASKFVSLGFVRLRAAIVDGMVELSVEDSGSGVAPEMRKVLFQKYHTSLEIVTQGNGIGLALCKNLVTLLGGSIFLDESYDSGIPGFPGARFVVRLNVPPNNSYHLDKAPPKDLEAQVESLSKVSTTIIPCQHSPLVGNQSPPNLPDKFSVLFVDDDNVLRKLFMRSLRKLCPTWRVQGASSGEAALDLIKNHHHDECAKHGEYQQQQPASDMMGGFDLIFVDQYMATTEPRMTGCETVYKLRERGINVTICGLSANDMEREFISAGADFFVLKPLPFEREALESVLVRMTKRSFRGVRARKQSFEDGGRETV